MSISGGLSPFDLSVTDGGSIQNANNLVGVIALADAGSVIHVVAKGGEMSSGEAFNGLVFSGPSGAELYFAHDSTVLPPLLALFQGQFFDIRLSMAANLAPSTGGAVVAPSNGVVGDIYYASDIQALCVSIGAGQWVSTNVTTGTAAAIPTAGILGQLYYATDTNQISIWAGTAWAPLGLMSGLAAALPATGTQGQMYLQTDTNRLSVWNSGKWVSTQLA